MTISTENKKALVCLTLGIALAYVIVFIVKKEKKEEGEINQPTITDANINIAVDAYKSGMDSGESKESLDEINKELKKEFGLSVEFKTLKNKYYVYDMAGKKVKEV